MLTQQRFSSTLRTLADSKATRLRFLPGRTATWMVTVQRRVENLGIRGFSDLFQKNFNFVCIDSEAALSCSRSAKIDLLEYSSNLSFCNVHDLINVAMAYRICGQKTTRAHVFWVGDYSTPKDMLISLVKFLNLLSAVNYRRMCNGPFKDLLRRLDDMEDRNASNGFLCSQLKSTRQALLQYLRRLVCVGYNIGTHLSI
ncbi:MAG: hypothetical protein GY740_23030 [Gammaproteobacteria bacterium]|nr:hypothetical protein [Gammaproteobacteria bacterium]